MNFCRLRKRDRREIMRNNKNTFECEKPEAGTKKKSAITTALVRENTKCVLKSFGRLRGQFCSRKEFTTVVTCNESNRPFTNHHRVNCHCDSRAGFFARYIALSAIAIGAYAFLNLSFSEISPLNRLKTLLDFALDGCRDIFLSSGTRRNS